MSDSLPEKVYRRFVDEFERAPEVIVDAPGRVNLIGEHVDYSGYSVLPMALRQRFYAAVSISGNGQLRLRHLESDRFGPLDVSMEHEYVIKPEKLKWYDYFMCGVRGVLEHLRDHLPKERRRGKGVVGFDAVVVSDIPASAGLSSSSALVCCGALCTLYASSGDDVFESVNRKTLANICATSERYCGTQGGGMDQAICLLAEDNMAKLIEFNPLRCQDVVLPKNACFVVCNTMVRADKAATSKYNQRVLECRLAAQVLAHSLGLDWKNINVLADVQLGDLKSLDEMARLVKEKLHKQPYDLPEICAILGTTDDDLKERSFPPNTYDKTSFQLRNRALHVYQEAARVYDFECVLKQTSNGSIGPDAAIDRLGQLMNASHVSCRDLFECSCPELEKLRDFCLKHGSAGTRLTGAGWGGATVSIMDSRKVNEFYNCVVGYYKNLSFSDDQIHQSVIISSASSGANVTKVNATTLAC